MKKISTALILVIALCLMLTACNIKNSENAENTSSVQATNSKNSQSSAVSVVTKDIENLDYIDFFVSGPSISEINQELGNYSKHDSKKGSTNQTTYNRDTYTYNNISIGGYKGTLSASVVSFPEFPKSEPNLIIWNTGKLKSKEAQQFFTDLAVCFDAKYSSRNNQTTSAMLRYKWTATTSKSIILTLNEDYSIEIAING